MDVTASVLEEKNFTAFPGKNIFSWNPDSINGLPGMYYIEAIGNGWKQRTKVVVGR
jgi:hypothetical protein